MKLFLISQEQWTGYDTFDSAVVAVESEDEARSMHPRGSVIVDWSMTIDWATDPAHVCVRYLGEAALDVMRGVVCASFNAG